MKIYDRDELANWTYQMQMQTGHFGDEDGSLGVAARRMVYDFAAYLPEQAAAIEVEPERLRELLRLAGEHMATSAHRDEASHLAFLFDRLLHPERYEDAAAVFSWEDTPERAAKRAERVEG